MERTISRREPGGGVVLAGGVLRFPLVIEQAGERAGRRFVEFFTAEIRNPHTRSLALGELAPFLVAS